MNHYLPKLKLYLIALGFIFYCSTSIQAQQRPDIYSFTPTEQLELRNLMMSYLTTPVVQQHLLPDPVIGNFHNYMEEFLTWHRAYIADMETYLLSQPGGSKYVPLPKWDPNTIIPDAFFNDVASPGTSSVASGWSLSTITNQDPANVNFTTLFNNLCSFTPSTGKTAIDNFAADLESRHDPVHGNVGGIMGGFQSPAAAIFWLWHAWVDDVYRQYECDCQMIDANDLYSKDTAEDIGKEANDESSIYYQSIDIWVRNNQDILLSSGRYSQEDNPNRHQNPEFRTSGPPNYVYVKIRNRGCNTVPASDAMLRVYWSKASTGLNWPTHFNNYTIGGILHGDELTSGAPVSIPALAPGETFVAELPWNPPNPADFTFDNQHFCLLSRIESTLDPMTFSEVSAVWANTRNNNNIAWKNLTVVDLDPFNLIGENTFQAPAFFIRQTLEVEAPLKITFEGPQELVQQGIMIEVDPKFIEAIQNQEVEYSGMRLTEDNQGVLMFELLENRAEILNLRLSPEEQLAMRLNFSYQCEPGEPCVQYGDQFEFKVEQYFQNDFADEFIGGNLYQIRITKNEKSRCQDDPIVVAEVQDASCANRTDGAINLNIENSDAFSVFWADGNQELSRKELAPGDYSITVRNNNTNCITDTILKVSDQSDLALVFDPTPTTRFCEKQGAISVSVKGGMPDYRVTWSTGETGLDLESLAPGMYIATVTDGEGCQRVDSVSVTQFFPLRLNEQQIANVSGANQSDGSIQVQFSGGQGPLSYTWEDGGTSNTIENLSVGNYQLTVTDQLGCTITDTFEVSIATDLKELSIPNPIRLFPNPTDDWLNVDLSLEGSISSEYWVRIYDLSGKVTLNLKTNEVAKVSKINLSYLEAGMYLFTLIKNNQTYSSYFIKQ